MIDLVQWRVCIGMWHCHPLCFKRKNSRYIQQTQPLQSKHFLCQTKHLELCMCFLTALLSHTSVLLYTLTACIFLQLILSGDVEQNPGPVDFTPSKAVALLHECGFNFKSKWSLLANILNVPLEQKEKMRAVIQEDEAYQYAVEIALDWWIKNTSKASWQELVSLVYRCGENDAADAMRNRLDQSPMVDDRLLKGEEHVDSVPKRPRTDLEELHEVTCQSAIQRKRPQDVMDFVIIMATPLDTIIDKNIACEAIQENFVDLTTASINPTWLATHLFASKVITLQQMKDSTDDSLRDSAKLTKLITLVLEGVYRNGHVYTTLLNILSKEEGDVYGWLIQAIEKSYENLKLSTHFITQPTGVPQPFDGVHQTHAVPANVEYSNASLQSTTDDEEHVDSVPKRPRTDLEGLDEVSCQSTIQHKRPHDIIV